MADDEVTPLTTTTANYGWVKPDVGASDDVWGGLLNADLDGIDSTVKSVSNAIPAASSTSPVMDGVVAVGTGTTWARADHVHPTDTSRAGIVGVTNGSDAPAGQIGEVISSNVTTPVTLTTGVVVNIASISLTAGDWEVQGEIYASIGTGGATLFSGGVTASSAVLPGVSSLGTSRYTLTMALSAGGALVFPLRSARVNVTVTTVYYLVAVAAFPSGSTTATGNIRARRAR